MPPTIVTVNPSARQRSSFFRLAKLSGVAGDIRAAHCHLHNVRNASTENLSRGRAAKAIMGQEIPSDLDIDNTLLGLAGGRGWQGIANISAYVWLNTD